MPFPPAGKFRLFLPPFPVGIDVTVMLNPPRLLMAGMVGPYVPSQDVFSFGPTFGVTCNGGSWTAVLPDKSGNPVEIAGPCEGPLP